MDYCDQKTLDDTMKCKYRDCGTIALSPCKCFCPFRDICICKFKETRIHHIIQNTQCMCTCCGEILYNWCATCWNPTCEEHREYKDGLFYCRPCFEDKYFRDIQSNALWYARSGRHISAFKGLNWRLMHNIQVFFFCFQIIRAGIQQRN